METAGKTAIVILTYNNLEYTRGCLESIRRHTEEGSYRIIVVDNGSIDGSREWLKTQQDIRLRLNETNEGFPRGCNLGIAMAEPEDDILLLNNDTVVTARWLENLRACLYSSPEIGAAGAVCNHNENLQGADFRYDTLEEMAEQAERNNVSDPTRWEEKIFLIGFCMLIRRAALDRAGPLDEAYSPGYVEDNDYSLRLISAGYRLMLCRDCFVHHYLGSGFRKDLSRFYPTLYANRRTFRHKWGFETPAFDEVKFASLRLLDEPDREKPLRVLELGCGIGVTLLKIRREYPNAELWGLEPDPAMARIAEKVARVGACPADRLPPPVPADYFDYIVAGNWFERTARPELAAAELRMHLRPGGKLIVELQNAAHFEVFRELLAGRWRGAKDRLDHRNRSVFTLDDGLNLFRGAGYGEPFVFHWFSVPSEEERELIGRLCEMGEEKREYIYRTYLYSIRLPR